MAGTLPATCENPDKRDRIGIGASPELRRKLYFFYTFFLQRACLAGFCGLKRHGRRKEKPSETIWFPTV